MRRVLDFMKSQKAHGESCGSRAFFALRIALLVLCTGAMAACTSIHVEGSGVVSTGWAFAPISIHPAEGIPATVIRSKGFGWVPHGDGVTLGYHNELRVMVVKLDACQLFILEPDLSAKDIERLTEVLKATGISLCSIPKEAK